MIKMLACSVEMHYDVISILEDPKNVISTQTVSYYTQDEYLHLSKKKKKKKKKRRERERETSEFGSLN